MHAPARDPRYLRMVRRTLPAMDCTEFRALPPATGALDDDVGDAWRAHLAACRACEDVVLDLRVRGRGLDPALFPCVHLAHYAAHLCEQHDDPMACPDAAVVWVPRFREWGLPIRDGEAAAAFSYVVIRHCPWCGVAAPDSLRTEWHAELGRRGFRNPLAAWDELPEDFLSDAWWRALEL